MTKAAVISAVALVAAALGAPGAPADPLPVRSQDDAAAPLASRIDAVRNVVAVMGARIVRIGDLVGTNPGPPNEPLLEARANAIAIAELSEELLCPTGRTIAAPGEGLIADDDRDAGDASATGVANQAQAVATVLAQAQQRLATIADAVLGTPGPPDEPVAAALTALYVESAETANRIAVLLGLDVLLPPGPC
jgi:hypothetical protein